jgi:hypothetical protein
VTTIIEKVRREHFRFPSLRAVEDEALASLIFTGKKWIFSNEMERGGKNYIHVPILHGP